MTLYNYRATVQRVVDGDTVDFIVDLGFRVNLQIRTRIAGVNAPELRTPEGKAAKAAVEEWLPVGMGVLLRTHKDPTDKFGRWLADVEHQGTSLSQWLLDNGHAVAYEEKR